MNLKSLNRKGLRKVEIVGILLNVTIVFIFLSFATSGSEWKISIVNENGKETTTFLENDKSIGKIISTLLQNGNIL